MSVVYNFSNYGQAAEIIQSQLPPEVYGSLALAKEANPGWSVIEGSKVTTIGETVGSSKVVPLSQYVKTAAELEGGVVSATEAVEVAETGVAVGEVTAGSSGIFAGWTIGTAVAGILAGVGVGISMYDSNPQFWVDVSNAIFPGEDIDYNTIKDYTILGLIKENLYQGVSELGSFISKPIVERVLDVANRYNMFTFRKNATIPSTSVLKYPDVMTLPVYFSESLVGTIDGEENFIITPEGSAKVVSMRLYTRVLGSYTHQLYFASKENFSVEQSRITRRPGQYTTAGHTYYCLEYSANWTESSSLPKNDYIYPGIGWLSDFAYVIFEGTVHSEGYPGAYELPDNPQIYNPNVSLDLQYPDWMDRGLNTHGLLNPYDDPSLYPIPWIPVIMPDADPIQTPERYPSPSQEPSPEPSPYPSTDPQTWAERGKLPNIIPTPYVNPTDDLPKKNPDSGVDKPDDKEPPTNPTPTPPIVFPTIGGEANALFTVYKPVISELNSLAGVLWSSNFLENLMKIFTNNPMDAVISLHMLYATPSIGSRSNIKLGYLDTGIASDVVNKQYISIDCGTVKIPEYFGDARDYVNTVVDIYLPFVGMRHLKTQDIIGSKVTVKACVDVFTGTVLYTINIQKSSGINQVMYAIEGNCAVALPLTGADRSRMFSVFGAAATGFTLGGAVGAAVGAFGSIMNGSQQADVQRTGNFGSNAGAMGVKKPYIVVSRNVGYDADNYHHYHGYPANMTVSLGSCQGFTRVLDVRLGSISNATKEELIEIESLLKQGVIF